MVSTLFLNQLGRLDKTLFVKLDKQIQRFKIFRKDRMNNVREILVVENPEGQFCYPNYEHIAKLYKMDTWINKNWLEEIDKHNDSLDEEDQRNLHYLSDQMSKLITRSKYF